MSAALKICIADDEEPIRENLGEAVEAMWEDASIDLVADGKAALEKVGSQKYDLLITDLKMPQMEGNELIGAIQDLPENVRPKYIIVLSGFIDVVDDYFQTENVYFFSKPLKLEAFEKLLSNLFDQ